MIEASKRSNMHTSGATQANSDEVLRSRAGGPAPRQPIFNLAAKKVKAFFQMKVTNLS